MGCENNGPKGLPSFYCFLDMLLSVLFHISIIPELSDYFPESFNYFFENSEIIIFTGKDGVQEQRSKRATFFLLFPRHAFECPLSYFHHSRTVRLFSRIFQLFFWK